MVCYHFEKFRESWLEIEQIHESVRRFSDGMISAVVKQCGKIQLADGVIIHSIEFGYASHSNIARSSLSACACFLPEAVKTMLLASCIACCPAPTSRISATDPLPPFEHLSPMLWLARKLKQRHMVISRYQIVLKIRIQNRIQLFFVRILPMVIR